MSNKPMAYKCSIWRRKRKDNALSADAPLVERIQAGENTVHRSVPALLECVVFVRLGNKGVAAIAPNLRMCT